MISIAEFNAILANEDYNEYLSSLTQDSNKRGSVLMNKEQFIEAAMQQQIDEEAKNLDRKVSNAERLQKQLAEIGIESEVSETGSVFIADEYEITDGYTQFSRSTYFLHKGEHKVDLYHNRIQDSIIAAIGKAMMQLDKPVPEKKQPKPAYTFSGESLGEILEAVMLQMFYKQGES